MPGSRVRSLLTSVKQSIRVTARRDTCQNERVADNKSKQQYVDNGWPAIDGGGHAVSELATDRTGALSPFGEVTFPLPADGLPYIHPVTVVNR